MEVCKVPGSNRDSPDAAAAQQYSFLKERTQRDEQILR